MTLKMFTRGHRSKPAEKELFGLCGAVVLHTRGLLWRMSTVASKESRTPETQKAFPCLLHQAGKMGWALQVPHWTQPGSWALNLNLSHLFGTRQLWPVMGRSHPFHSQRLIRQGQRLLLLILLFWSESLHVFHCSSPPCSPPAGTKPPNLAVH